MFGIFGKSKLRAAQAEEAAVYFEKKWMESQIQVLQLRAMLADKRLSNSMKELEVTNIQGGLPGGVASFEAENSKEAWAAYNELQSDYEVRYCS